MEEFAGIRRLLVRCRKSGSTTHHRHARQLAYDGRHVHPDAIAVASVGKEVHSMRSPIIVGSLFIIAMLVATTNATPSVKWAAVNLTDTTMIAGTFVSGPVVFVHDDARMARGEPCTGVYRFVPGKGPGEEIVAFHCKPRWGKAPARFTAAMASRPDGPPVLTEYQFAGDEEAHIVPTR
jgi:hypothetical protein